MRAPVFGRLYTAAFTRPLFADRLCPMFNETRPSYYRLIYRLTAAARPVPGVL